MEVMLGILIVLNCFLIGNIILLKINNDFYKNECERYEKENECLRLRIKAYRINESYQNHMYQNKTKNIYNNDIKEAVKYAMKKSHPDNGGSSDEFNKFRELYNKVK